MTGTRETSRVSRVPPPPIPVTVLTGFLGAGKTTLLNRLLADPLLADTAVIINEFGEVGLDHLLVEPAADGIVTLATGCLCCTLRGDLIDALERLLRSLDNGRAAFSRVVIETTGLADPAPVLHTLMRHPYLALRYRLDGIVTVVDAVNGAATLTAHAEAVKQVAVADRLVLTKTDLAKTDLAGGPAHHGGPTARDGLRSRLRSLNPSAPLLDAAAGEADARRLLDCGLYDPASKTPDVRRWLAAEAYAAAGQEPHHGRTPTEAAGRAPGHVGEDAADVDHDPSRHDAQIRAFCLSAPGPVAAASLDLFLDLLRSLHGPNLLRVKGIVKLAEDVDRPVVVHAVQHLMHPPARLAGWPDADQSTRMVFIVRDIEPRIVSGLFDALMGTPAPDRPDHAAIADNPLVPFGGVDR